jgi:hypothetical protein
MVWYEEKHMRAQQKAILASVVAAAITFVTGCRIDADNKGDDKNVKIATPFGGMQVKTNDASVEEGLGLPVYPGAELVKKKGDDSGAADINFSLGKFQLRVKAASYHTPDAPDKVQAFYKNALKRYGTVIQCNNNQPVGTPTTTDEGLTCDSDHGKNINVNSDVSGKSQLKAGSKQHQHVVAIDPDGSGTKFGVIALDLPINITVYGDDTRQ